MEILSNSMKIVYQYPECILKFKSGGTWRNKKETMDSLIEMLYWYRHLFLSGACRFLPSISFSLCYFHFVYISLVIFASVFICLFQVLVNVYTRWACAIFNFFCDSRTLRVGTPAGKMYLRNVMWTHNSEPELSHVYTLEYPILSHANYLEVGSKRKALIMIMERGGKSVV